MEFWGFFFNAAVLQYILCSEGNCKLKSHMSPPTCPYGPRDWPLEGKSGMEWPSVSRGSQAEMKGKGGSGSCALDTPCSSLLAAPHRACAGMGHCACCFPHLGNPLKGKEYMRSPCSWLPRNTRRKRIGHNSFLLSQQSQSLEIPASLKLCRSGYQQDAENFCFLHTDILVSEHTSKTS